MARQVLPLVGAVAGFAIGGPTGAQIGFALGSLVGNAVDPIEMQGRKLGDAPTQVAAEGGARAIVYGKGCIRATCVIERGGRRVIRQRDRSGGKGGGPTTINERALWTFAIGLGEPVAAVLHIWENEKLVYDVTPTSTIPEDTAQFAEKFRFYTGAEDQLPDPALEALHGAGNAPYYRGTAYMVFPQYDLTDFGETVPTYRVEVAVDASEIVPSISMSLGYKDATITAWNGHSEDGVEWSETTTEAAHFDASYVNLVLGLEDAFLAYGFNHVHRSTDRVTWTLVWSGTTSGGTNTGAASGDVVLLPCGASYGYLRSVDKGVNFTQYPGSITSDLIAFNTDNPPRALSAGITVPLCVYSDSMGADGSWTPGAAHGISLLAESAICGVNDIFALGGQVGSAPAVRFLTGPTLGSLHTFSGTGGVSALCGVNIDDQEIVVAGLSDGRLFWTEDRGLNWVESDQMAPASVNSIAFNGVRLIAGGSISTGGNAFIMTSEDGKVWVEREQPLSDKVLSVACLYPRPPQLAGDPVPLSTVVSSMHERCGHDASDYNVSELSEIISGVVIESTVTAAEGINSLIGSHFADPSDYDGQIHYIKRGKPVVLTLTEDDLIDEPDEAQRNNAIEYPKKVHFLGQRADLAYASSKSTSARYSDDAKVVGEITIGSPETYDDGIGPAEVAVKLHKVLWTEAEGEREWIIPDNYLKLVPTDNVGLSYRGELVRCRILNIEDTPGQRKLRMIRDRQSAYTANLTEIPNPPAPTPPQSSVIAPTIMAFIDSSALTDNADTLHYLVALSGANDNWAGAALQQQLSGDFTTIDSTTLNSVMGTLQNTVTDASPYYTDTTNTLTVRLFTDDTLESRTDAEFLSNGGAFFLSSPNSGQTEWEIMQFRDAVQDSNGDWILSHLMRGRKNTPTAEHTPGSIFVWIDPAILRESAQSSWIGTTLTHRAVSNGQSPELATIQNNEYVGNSQREWPVADLTLSRPTADSVLAEAIPRYRFGTSMNPIRSQNMEQFTWTATDGVNYETAQTPFNTPSYTFDTTGWGSPVTVTVAQWNRITGDGPTVSEEIV